jgi:hypothetical protein
MLLWGRRGRRSVGVKVLTEVVSVLRVLEGERDGDN